MAEELMARVDRDGRVCTMGELELLVRVIEVATSVPQALRDYTLRQVEEAVILGEGPTRHGELTRQGINAAEVAQAIDRPAAFLALHERRLTQLQRELAIVAIVRLARENVDQAERFAGALNLHLKRSKPPPYQPAHGWLRPVWPAMAPPAPPVATRCRRWPGSSSAWSRTLRWYR